jgi:hypothetical protein
MQLKLGLHPRLNREAGGKQRMAATGRGKVLQITPKIWLMPRRVVRKMAQSGTLDAHRSSEFPVSQDRRNGWQGTLPAVFIPRCEGREQQDEKCCLMMASQALISWPQCGDQSRPFAFLTMCLTRCIVCYQSCDIGRS